MRSKLFVPGSRPEFFPKALAGAADAIAFDLEDAVQETRKAEAREWVSHYLNGAEAAASAKTLIVRVNALTTTHFEADLAAVMGTRMDLVNVPKVESADDIRVVSERLTRIERDRELQKPMRILANIESPRGLRCAAEIAFADKRVVGLQLGYGDLFGPLGIERSNTEAVHHVMMSVRLAAGEAGIWAYDAAFGAVNDPDGYQKEARMARQLGYLGKTCIHPSQVALANEVFRPSEKEIADALRVVMAATDAEKNGLGAFTVEGQMIDQPFITRAKMIVALARQLGLVVD